MNPIVLHFSLRSLKFSIFSRSSFFSFLDHISLWPTHACPEQERKKKGERKWDAERRQIKQKECSNRCRGEESYERVWEIWEERKRARQRCPPLRARLFPRLSFLSLDIRRFLSISRFHALFPLLFLSISHFLTLSNSLSLFFVSSAAFFLISGCSLPRVPSIILEKNIYF